jgi:hypothetical protein
MLMRPASLLLSGFLSITTNPRAEATQASQGPIFRFEADGFWLNLHSFLYVLGRAEAGMRDIKRRAVVGAPADQDAGLRSLTDAERNVWRDAVTAYAKSVSLKDAVFDAEVFDVSNALVALKASDDLDRAKGLNPAVRAILEKAAPIYRKAWWPQHQQSNTDRVAQLQRLVAQYGDQVLRYITRAYQEPWPAGGYPVNISAYTNWAGAYSTRGDLLVFSSTDPGNTGTLGLEIVFHEAMHQWDQQMMKKLADAGKQSGKRAIPGGITHSMIFFTAGEAVRSVVPAHTPYADVNGIWRTDNHVTNKPLLDAAWKPYLDGQGTLSEALVGLLQ